MLALICTVLLAGPPIVDNAWVRVTRNEAPCADASAGCGRRIIVALGPVRLGGASRRTLAR